MLEDECSVLDIKTAEKLAEKKEGTGNENFQSLIESVEKMSHVETSMAKLNDELQFLNDAIHVQLWIVLLLKIVMQWHVLVKYIFLKLIKLQCYINYSNISSLGKNTLFADCWIWTVENYNKVP